MAAHAATRGIAVAFAQKKRGPVARAPSSAMRSPSVPRYGVTVSENGTARLGTSGSLLCTQTFAW